MALIDNYPEFRETIEDEVVRSSTDDLFMSQFKYGLVPLLDIGRVHLAYENDSKIRGVIALPLVPEGITVAVIDPEDMDIKSFVNHGVELLDSLVPKETLKVSFGDLVGDLKQRNVRCLGALAYFGNDRDAWFGLMVPKVIADDPSMKYAAELVQDKPHIAPNTELASTAITAGLVDYVLRSSLASIIDRENPLPKQ